MIERYEKMTADAARREQRALWKVRRKQLTGKRRIFLQREETDYNTQMMELKAQRQADSGVVSTCRYYCSVNVITSIHKLGICYKCDLFIVIYQIDMIHIMSFLVLKWFFELSECSADILIILIKNNVRRLSNAFINQTMIIIESYKLNYVLHFITIRNSDSKYYQWLTYLW